MVTFSAGTAPDLAHPHAFSEVISVDLGFSETAASCGLTWRGCKTPHGLPFGACVRRVVELVDKADSVALVLEAPLSATFTTEGNPVARDYGATRSNGRSMESGRGWYYGPGAIVALAAVFFLRGLA